MREIFESLFQNLKPKEADVLKKRFGFDCEPMTLEELGKEYGVTRERIRQIEARAIKTLRHPKYSRSLNDFREGIR